MNNLKLVFKLVPFIVRLIGLAEDAISEPGNGATKKELVIDGVKTVVDAITEVSTGGQSETWGAIKSTIDNLIDTVVGLMNTFGWFK